jgi:D-amino-acid dehydrogenase
MSKNRPDAIVIGGGVVGAACAYYLSVTGLNVRVLDAGKLGGACSHGNCGFICPSHVLPLASPGAVAKVARAMLRGNAPLAIRPGLDVSLWAWLWNFTRRCREDCMLEAANALHALLQSSRGLYEDLKKHPEFDCEWQEKGLLFVYNSTRDFEAYTEIEELIRRHFAIAGSRIDAAELPSFEPALKEGLAGAWHYSSDSHLRPDKLMSSWRRLLEGKGIEIVEDVRVESIDVAGGAVRSLSTASGSMAADTYVLATGAWASQLGKQLNCRLPIQPGKGYSITMPTPEGAPTIPMILEEYHVGVTPMISGFRLGSTMELAGYDATINRRRLALLKRGAEKCLRTPYCEPVLEQWYGWRPMTYDSLPCIGPVPNIANAYVAAGHGMLGVSMSTGTGKLLAELISGGEGHIDPAPYSVLRFARSYAPL